MYMPEAISEVWNISLEREQALEQTIGNDLTYNVQDLNSIVIAEQED
jgi:hypothetical protein